MKMPRPKRPQRLASDLAELGGLVLLDRAAWLIHPVAGLIVLGLVLLLIGWVIDREPAPKGD